MWPYTWGRIFRFLSFPVDLLFRLTSTRTVVLGQEHLADLPSRVIFAGTHHSFADLSLIRWGLAHSPARTLVTRLLVTVGGPGFLAAGLYARYATLAFGMFHLGKPGDGRKLLARLAEASRHDNAVLIFPQGQHVTPEREQAGDRTVGFRRGVAYLSIMMNAPVVPFGLAGTEQMMPPFLQDFRGPVIAGIPVSLKRGPSAIAFGAPLAIAEGELPRGFAARLQQASYALTRQAEEALQSMRWAVVSRGSR